MRATWDIFCRVIDNFGDIGVTWRLAQQLQREQGFAVRLWVDDVVSFNKICPAVQLGVDQQELAGVLICHWREGLISAQSESADVVIEAFACQLPEHYIALMRAKQQVLWLNLEYLTAEPWAAQCHTLPSLQSGGLQKYFFFPGFTEDTGGLLREQGLLAQRNDFFASDSLAQAFLATVQVQPLPGERLISLFAYANQGLPSLLQALSNDTRRNRYCCYQAPCRAVLPNGLLSKACKWGAATKKTI